MSKQNIYKKTLSMVYFEKYYCLTYDQPGYSVMVFIGRYYNLK